MINLNNKDSFYTNRHFQPVFWEKKHRLPKSKKKKISCFTARYFQTKPFISLVIGKKMAAFRSVITATFKQFRFFTDFYYWKKQQPCQGITETQGNQASLMTLFRFSTGLWWFIFKDSRAQAFDLEGGNLSMGRKAFYLHSLSACSIPNLARDLPAGEVLSHGVYKSTGPGLVSFVFFGKSLEGLRQLKG